MSSRHGDRDDRVVLRLATRLGALFGLAGVGASSSALAVDTVAEVFEVGRGQAVWCLSLYAVTLAVGTMLFGHLADALGTRRPLLAAVGLMSMGAVVAGASPVFAILLAARVVQGAGAAGVLTLCVVVLAETVQDERQPAALMRLAAWGSCLSCLGPLAAGVLVDAGHWRFAMALPAMGLLLLPLVTSALHGRQASQPRDLGRLICVAGIVSGLVLLLQSPSTGAGSAVAGAGLVGGFGLATLILRRRASVRLSMLQQLRTHRVLVRGAVVAACVPASWFALLVAMPVMLGEAGWNTTQMGLALVPSAVVGLATPRLAGGRLANRDATARLAVAASCAAFALILAAAGRMLGLSEIVILSAAAVTVGFAVAHPSLASLVAENVVLERQGTALGAATLVFIAGGGMGSAVLAGTTPRLGLAGGLCALALMPLVGAVFTARASSCSRPADGSSPVAPATDAVRHQQDKRLDGSRRRR